MAVAKDAVARLTGDETPESLCLSPLPIHRRLGLVTGETGDVGAQLELIGLRSGSVPEAAKLLALSRSSTYETVRHSKRS